MDPLNQTRYTLLQRACDLNDEQAWAELEKHYRRFIYYILNGMGVAADDIDDVTQQVMISLTKDISGYDRSRARFRTWFGMVIRNAALSYFRDKRNRQKCIERFIEKQEPDSNLQIPEIDSRIEREWAAYVSNLAMERVQEVFKGQAIEVFKLGLDGLSAEEIAQKTGLSVASVYTLKKRVKRRLYLEIRARVAELEPS